MASVTNRFVVIPMDAKYQCGSKESLFDIDRYLIADEVYATRYNLAKDPIAISKCYLKRGKHLIDNGLDPRYADVRAYIFVMNDLFNLQLSENDLLKWTKQNLKNI